MSNQTGVRKPRTAHPTKLPGIPKPPADVSGSLRQYLTSVSEALEVRLGRKGDPRDAAVTFRDLIESGLAVEIYYGSGGGGGGTIGPPNPDGPGVPGIEDPTGPTGFRASGAMYNISLWWNAARYEYGGHSYTEIWRAGPVTDADGNVLEDQEPTLEDAIEVGTSVGTTYVDPVGSGKTFWYWIRHVNIEGVKGPWAAPYPQGLSASTQPDIELLLELLDGLIGEDQLTQDLQEQIQLIGALEEFTGYYQGWEIDYNGVSLNTRMGAVEYWQNDENGEWYTFSAQYAQQIQTLVETDQALAEQITQLSAEISGEDGFVTNAVFQEAITTLAAQDEALAQQITQLETSVGQDSAAIEQLLESVDGLEAQYTVKTQVSNAGGTYVAGFGLANTNNNGTVVSRFVISADQFAVINPAVYPLSTNQNLNNSTIDPYTPFQILTTDQYYDGIKIPKGVYIKDAYIGKARILELIAGSVVADFMESTVAMSAPSIFGGTINIGTIVKPNASPRSWYVSGSQRVGNFSVDAQGIMHAYGASLYGITIYAQDNTVLLDSGGFGISTGGNSLINGELNHPLNVTADPPYTGAPFIDNDGNALKGWYRGSKWNGSSYFAAGNSQCFQLVSNSEIYSGYVPVMAAGSNGDRPLYLTVNMYRPSSSNDQFYFRVAYYNASKQFLGSEYQYAYESTQWGNGETEYPGYASGNGSFSTVFDDFRDTRTAYVRLIVGTNNVGNYINIFSLYLGVNPMEMSSSYAPTYIRSLYVNQLTGDVNTITAFRGSASRTIGPSSSGYKEMFTVICEQNEAGAITHEATIQGVFSAQYRTDTAYVKLEWRRRTTRSQGTESWSGWSQVNVLKHKTSEGGSSWTTLPFAGGTGVRYNTDVQFRVSVYMRNDNDNGNTDKSRTSTIQYSGNTIGVV